MAAIAVSESIVRKLKVALRERLPFIQSSHLSEAIARGFGFNTNIAFHSFLERQHASTTCVFDAAMFESRLSVVAHHVVPKLSFESLFVELGLLAVPEQFLVDQAALADTNSLVHRHPALLARVRRRCSATFGEIFGLGHILGLDKDKNSALVLRAGVDHGAAQRGWGNVVNTYASGINFPGADHTVSYYERLPLANGKYIEYCTAVVSMPYHNDYRLEKFERAKKVAGRVGWKVSEHHSWSWHMAGATDLMLFQPATSVAETKKLWDGSFKRWLVENKTRLTRSARPYRRHCIQDAIECQHIPLDVETFEQFEQRYLHEYIPAYEYGSRHGAGPIFRDLFNKWRKETGGSDIRE